MFTIVIYGLILTVTYTEVSTDYQLTRWTHIAY